MFNLHSSWKIYAVMLIDGDRARVFLIGFDGKLPKDAEKDFLFHYGYHLVEICEDADKQKFIDAGLTSTAPMMVTGFTVEPLKKEENASPDQKSFEFTNANSFVQSRDGKFESQYCMCSGCNHPVTVSVNSVITQAILDKLNTGATVELSEGEICYSCNNCGNSERKVYKDLLVWKTLSCHALSFEEAVKKVKGIKDKYPGFYMPMPENYGFAEELRDMEERDDVELPDEGRPEMAEDARPRDEIRMDEIHAYARAMGRGRVGRAEVEERQREAEGRAIEHLNEVFGEAMAEAPEPRPQQRRRGNN